MCTACISRHEEVEIFVHCLCIKAHVSATGSAVNQPLLALHQMSMACARCVALTKHSLCNFILEIWTAPAHMLSAGGKIKCYNVNICDSASLKHCSISCRPCKALLQSRFLAYSFWDPGITSLLANAGTDCAIPWNAAGCFGDRSNYYCCFGQV